MLAANRDTGDHASDVSNKTSVELSATQKLSIDISLNIGWIRIALIGLSWNSVDWNGRWTGDPRRTAMWLRKRVEGHLIVELEITRLAPPEQVI